jgi:hypothetical protein
VPRKICERGGSAFQMNTIAVAVLVGLCWGGTNTFVRSGVLAAEAAQRRGPAPALASMVGAHWASLLTTPSFVLPQLANWAASALMVVSLASGKLHVAQPVANAVSIAANAITARLVFKDRIDDVLLTLGVLCIGAGIVLTGL